MAGLVGMGEGRNDREIGLSAVELCWSDGDVGIEQRPLEVNNSIVPFLEQRTGCRQMATKGI